MVLQPTNSGLSPGNQANIEKGIESAKYLGEKVVASISKRSTKIAEALSARTVSKLLKATKLLGKIDIYRRF